MTSSAGPSVLMMSYVCADVLWLGAGSSLLSLSFEINGNMVIRSIGGRKGVVSGGEGEGDGGRHSLLHKTDISAIVPIRCYHKRRRKRGVDGEEEEVEEEKGEEKEGRKEEGKEEEERDRASAYLLDFEWTEGVREVLSLDLNGEFVWFPCEC